ncbi:endonuclease/exonuclease/phosphatase family protein [Emticicia sp. TH156]|uniref:endonuclease/exonuclease/phosphatase family protein n=1 Tax=Emticicia sp. TH156 TaxID=2067454 RepID=UPI000C7817DB|nr:endonuclease/exonuclease/phosphatase family protein [Emticicia sp. TH156]PLK44076.1 endonuclease/exonuclease/phosphatase [Emticicia sp. TH156]
MTVLNGFKIFVWAMIQTFGEIALVGLKSIATVFKRYPRSYMALFYLFITMAFCYYPIFGHWLTGFIMMSLPLAVLAGLTASSYLLYKNQKLIASAGFIWVLMTFPIIKRFVGIGNSQPDFGSAQSLKVLSFNSESFGGPDRKNVNWATLKADIACFQEYVPNGHVEEQYQDKFEKLISLDATTRVGLALFSQYPIIKQYSKIWDRDGQPNINGFICADIAYEQDTVRVVNVHLWSMGVRINKAADAFKKGHIGEFFIEISDTFRRLKEGFEARDEQIKEVESYVAGSKYPVIICGDFNEIPFGYAYGKLRLSFKNAFEDAGQGLGFTLNRKPYWVRIDQQFFSADWQVQSCQTMRGITFSDHFPVVAKYVLKKSIDKPTPLVAQR